MKRLTTVLLAAGITVASVLTASTAGAIPAQHPGPKQVQQKWPKHTPGYNPPPIKWGPCASPSMVAAHARCGLLTVPLDYSRPNGRTIRIGVSEIKHLTSDADAQGIMLVNPGGPGGSGLTLARLGEFVPHGGGDPYDWIGFDPRGVGTSRPSLSCDGNYFPTNRPDYVPTTKALESFWLNKTAKYAKKCNKAGGALLDHLKTNDTVNDMESIRKAFDARRINFYGFSYGTYLGQVYSTQHPNRVRRMIFDGVVDPRDVWYEANLNQDYAFDKTIGVWFGWVARHDSTYHLGTTKRSVQKLWYKMLDKARKAPFDGQIGPDEWTDAFLSAGYYVYGWTDSADAFAAAVNGDYGLVEDAYAGANGSGPGSDNGYAIYLATQCTDVQWPTSWKKWRRDNDRVYAEAPFETWANAWYNAPCLTWGAEAAKNAPTVHGTKVPPILLIEETKDAATPYPGAIEVRKRFPTSVLIEGVGGTTHAGSLSGVACTDDRIADYLLTGKLDKRRKGNHSDVQCDPVPPPEPSSASRQKAAALGLPIELRDAITAAQK